MAVVPVVGLIFDVGRVNGDTTSPLLRRFVDICVVGELRTTTLCEHLGDSGGQGGLSVIDVAWISEL